MSTRFASQVRVHALRATLALCILSGAAWPGTAQAGPTGSIVFTKAGNVYRAGADGSRVRRLSRDGTRSHPYRSATQADDGTVAAVRDYTTLTRFTRTGRRIGRPHKIASGLRSAGSLHDLAIAAAVSPNGREVAVENTLLQGFSSGNGLGGLEIISVTVQYRRATSGAKLAERHIAGDYLESPSWIDNRQVLIFRPNAGYAAQALVDTRGGALRPWFSDDAGGDDPFARKPIDDGELTRNQKQLAMIRGTNVPGDWRSSQIVIYSVAGFSTGPTPVCIVDHTGSGPFSHPTWAPDGSALAYSDDRGIWFSRIDAGASNCGIAPRLIIRGGTAPDWGPSR